MKYYCWVSRTGNLHIDTEDQDWDYNPYIAFYIGTIEAKDIEEARQKAVNKNKENILKFFKGGK
jgi:hypothetical protein